MKSTSPALTSVQTLDRTWIADLCELSKARLTSLVLLTTLVGYYLGQVGTTNYFSLFNAVMGTAWLAAGAAALNQVWERDCDARMFRTANRPLPSGRMLPEVAFTIGLTAAAFGLAQLFWGTNLLAASLGALTLTIYLPIYTPLKRKTSWNTLVGAIPGALPPLIGWTAARGEVGWQGWTLFALQFLWQIPHFLAIAWLYRDDYARGGYRMLPLTDTSGVWTGRLALLPALALLPTGIVPYLLGVAGPVYLAGSLAAGIAFAVAAGRFARQLTPTRARALFYSSLIYLPLVFTLMVADKR